MSIPIDRDTRAAVVAGYQAGATQIELASKYNLGAATVHRIIKKAGAQRGNPADDAEKMAAAVADYVQSRLSMKAIAKKHGLPEDPVARAIRDAGVARSIGGGYSEATKTAAVQMFRDGVTIREVAAAHDISVTSVTAWLRAAEVSAEDREDRQSPVDYIGGWVLRGGVKYPVEPMRKKVA